MSYLIMSKTSKSIKSQPKKAPNVYALRSNNCILSLGTKLEEEQKECVKCPPLQKKRSYSFYSNRDDNAGAHPLGKKGKLSPNYKPDTGISYIKQLFVQVGDIGEGSFGNVYKYYSLDDKSYYAIKIIKKYHKSKYSEIDHLDEISDNSYCMQYCNAWEELGIIYIQFELGIMSVGDYAKKNHNICEEECWNILYDVLQALIGIHKKSFCHMDIKPDNIVITTEGKYKLCDFGLLAYCNMKPEHVIGSEGDARYLALEVFQGNITAAVDIFALGITMMELSMDLLLPVYGSSWHDLRKSSLRLLPNQGRISSELETTINWMMDAHPLNRPTAEQLLRTPKLLSRMRAKKPRFNYFDAWYQTSDSPKEIPQVYLTLQNNDNDRYDPYEQMDTLDRNDSDNVNNEAAKTPPRRVSSVIVRMSLMFDNEEISSGEDAP